MHRGPCSINSDIITLLNCVGREGVLEEEQSLHAFPNPVIDDLYLSGLKENSQLKLYTINNTLVKEWVASSSHTLSMKDYAKGMYLLKILSDNTIKVMKIVKE